jgi:hypothetical protein
MRRGMEREEWYRIDGEEKWETGKMVDAEWA